MILKKNIRFSIILIIFLTSLSSFSQDTIIFQPGSEEGKDAYLRTLTPNTNYGDHHDFAAIGWTFHGPYVCTRSMIEFDLSYIPENTQILSAKLSLYGNPTSCNHQGHSSLSGSNKSYLQRIITQWEEYTTTWNNPPLTTSANAIILRETNNPLEDYIDIDVTTLVQDMINDPENSYGFMIKLVNEEHYRSMVFSSSDQEDPDNHPKLEIIFGCETTIADFSTDIDNLIVEFTDASQHPDNWYWDFGDGSFSTQQNPMHEYSSAGTYNVCLITENSCSSDTICKSISVCNNTVSNFNYETNIKNVNFTDVSINPTSWHWDFGDGRTSTEQNPSHEYSAYGTYNVCLTIENSCSSDIFCDSIFVCKNTVADYVYFIEGTTVDFLDASSYTNTWFWDFGDGSYSTQQNPSHQFKDYVIYYVCLTASNECSSDVFCDSIFNIRESDNLNLVQVYPNPPSSTLTISNPTSLSNITVQIFTLYGDKLFEKEIDFEYNSTFKMDLSDLPSAQYFLKMINGNKSETRKIFIVK